MRPRRHRPGLEADIGAQDDARTPAYSAAPCGKAPTLIPFDVEPRNLDVNVQNLGRTWQRDLLVEDPEEPRRLPVGAMRVDRDGLDESARELAGHGNQDARARLSTVAFGSWYAATIPCTHRLGRRHLETVLAEYAVQFQLPPAHRSLGQRAPSALDATPALIGRRS